MAYSPGTGGPNPLKLKDAERPGATVEACQVRMSMISYGGFDACLALTFNGAFPQRDWSRVVFRRLATVGQRASR